MDSSIIIILVSPLSFLWASVVIIKFIPFFNKNPLSKQNTVCICPKKGTPGLYELMMYPIFIVNSTEIDPRLLQSFGEDLSPYDLSFW